MEIIIRKQRQFNNYIGATWLRGVPALSLGLQRAQHITNTCPKEHSCLVTQNLAFRSSTGKLLILNIHFHNNTVQTPGNTSSHFSPIPFKHETTLTECYKNLCVVWHWEMDDILDTVGRTEQGMGLAER